MGLFGKKKQEGVEEEAPQRRVNPTNMIMIRLLAVGYILWILKDLVVMYIEGAEGAPELWMLILTIVLFVGGCAWILWMSFKQYKQMKAQQEAEAAALAEEEAALEAAKEAEAQAEDWEEEPEETEE